MRKILALACITVTALLTACGGGGGGGSKTTETFTPQAMTVALADTSYANAKMRNIAPVTLPTEVKGQDVFAVAEFKKGSNDAVLFTAELRGTGTGASFVEDNSIFKFWTQTADGWRAATDMFNPESVGGCLHPRKAMVIDVNSDSVPDVVVACHGYDNYDKFTPALTKGERMQVILSQTNGKFTVKNIGDVGYWHGAAAYKTAGGVVIVAVDNVVDKLVKFELDTNGVATTRVEVAAAADKYTVEVVKNGTDFDAYVAGNGAVLVASALNGTTNVTSLGTTADGYGTVVDLVVGSSNKVILARACYDTNCTSGNSQNNTYITALTGNNDEATVANTTNVNATVKGWISQLTVFANKVVSLDAERGALNANVLF